MPDRIRSIISRYNFDVKKYFEDEVAMPKVFKMWTVKGLPQRIKVGNKVWAITKSFSQVAYISLSDQLNAEDWVSKSYDDNYSYNKVSKTGTRAWFILNEDFGIEVYKISYRLV